MKKLITMENLTFTKKNCNCGLQSNNTETSNTNKINLVLLKKIGSPIYNLQFNEKKINFFLRKELVK